MFPHLAECPNQDRETIVYSGEHLICVGYGSQTHVKVIIKYFDRLLSLGHIPLLIGTMTGANSGNRALKGNFI